MEDHIPIRTDRSLLLGRQTSKWSLWDVVFHGFNFELAESFLLIEIRAHKLSNVVTDFSDW